MIWVETNTLIMVLKQSTLQLTLRHLNFGSEIIIALNVLNVLINKTTKIKQKQKTIYYHYKKCYYKLVITNCNLN